MADDADDDDDDASCPRMSADILGTNCDQCRSMGQCYFTSTETVGLSGTGTQDGHLDVHTAPELRREQDKARQGI